VKPIAESVLMLLVESELPIEDIKYLLQTTLPLSIENNVARAYKKFWGKEQYEVTLFDVEQSLRGNGKPKQKRDKKD